MVHQSVQQQANKPLFPRVDIERAYFAVKVPLERQTRAELKILMVQGSMQRLEILESVPSKIEKRLLVS